MKSQRFSHKYHIDFVEEKPSFAIVHKISLLFLSNATNIHYYCSNIEILLIKGAYQIKNVYNLHVYKKRQRTRRCLILWKKTHPEQSEGS